MKKLLGNYPYGYLSVDIWYDTDLGGGVGNLDNTKKTPQVTIGVYQDEWYGVLDNLMHELIETAFNMYGNRYKAATSLLLDSSECLIVCDHHQFSRAVAMAAMTVAKCQNALHAVWKAEKKKRERG